MTHLGHLYLGAFITHRCAVTFRPLCGQMFSCLFGRQLRSPLYHRCCTSCLLGTGYYGICTLNIFKHCQFFFSQSGCTILNSHQQYNFSPPHACQHWLLFDDTLPSRCEVVPNCSYFFFKSILFLLGHAMGLWDLNSLTRDWTWVLGNESTES